MSIPADILYMVKSILRIPASDGAWDFKLNDLYEDEFRVLSRTQDWCTEVETINVVANQSRYLVQARGVRVLAVFHQSIMLGKVTGLSQDRLKPAWQNDAANTPKKWWMDELPDTVGFTPQVFFVYPKPAASVTGGFVLYEVCTPLNTSPSFRWIRPYLILATAAAFREGSHVLRDPRDADFWRSLAKLWLSVLEKRTPR